MRVKIKEPVFTCTSIHGHKDCRHADQEKTKELSGLIVEVTLQECGSYRCDREVLFRAIESRDGLDSPLYKYWKVLLHIGRHAYFTQQEIEPAQD